jgi:D-ribose pyranase
MADFDVSSPRTDNVVEQCATGLLHPALVEAVARLGHLDEILVCDAGFPVPEATPRIDLAYRPGMPSFLDGLRAIAAEVVVDRAIVADEAASEIVAAVAEVVGATVERMPRAAIKKRSGTLRFVVRTGEFTPYANALLVMGVPFMSCAEPPPHVDRSLNSNDERATGPTANAPGVRTSSILRRCLPFAVPPSSLRPSPCC